MGERRTQDKLWTLDFNLKLSESKVARLEKELKRCKLERETLWVRWRDSEQAKGVDEVIFPYANEDEE